MPTKHERIVHDPSRDKRSGGLIHPGRLGGQLGCQALLGLLELCCGAECGRCLLSWCECLVAAFGEIAAGGCLAAAVCTGTPPQLTTTKISVLGDQTVRGGRRLLIGEGPVGNGVQCGVDVGMVAANIAAWTGHQQGSEHQPVWQL